MYTNEEYAYIHFVNGFCDVNAVFENTRGDLLN